jgi:hypothetical protein
MITFQEEVEYLLRGMEGIIISLAPVWSEWHALADATKDPTGDENEFYRGFIHLAANLMHIFYIKQQKIIIITPA